jgi:hypothetical protein
MAKGSHADEGMESKARSVGQGMNQLAGGRETVFGYKGIKPGSKAEKSMAKNSGAQVSGIKAGNRGYVGPKGKGGAKGKPAKRGKK